jgi:hypothetical protein
MAQVCPWPAATRSNVRSEPTELGLRTCSSDEPVPVCASVLRPQQKSARLSSIKQACACPTLTSRTRSSGATRMGEVLSARSGASPWPRVPSVLLPQQ